MKLFHKIPLFSGDGFPYYEDDECGKRAANIIHGRVKSNTPPMLATDITHSVNMFSPTILASMNMSWTYLQLSSTSIFVDYPLC